MMVTLSDKGFICSINLKMYAEMKRIMIVEDEPLIGGLIAGIIRRMGHEVCGQVSTARKALAVSGELKPDLMLVDINLGGEMDGLEAAQQMIDQHNLPVIFISASYDDYIIDRARMSGAYGYVLKPFRNEELEIIVTMSLQRIALENRLKRNEQLLYKSEQHYRMLIENGVDLITIVTDDGIILFQSISITRILGYEDGELIGENIINYIKDEDKNRIRGAIKDAMNSDGIFNSEFSVRKKNDEWALLDVNGRIVPDTGKEGFSVILNSRDVTERMKMVEDLRIAKESAEVASRSKSIFLANMSHELKTPLNVLLGYCRLLEMQKAGPMNDKQLEFVTIMQDSGRHLLDMLEDILDVSKIEAGKLALERKRIDIVDLLHRFHQSIAILADRKSIMLIFDISPESGYIDADEVRLKQILYNLLSNAIKFTDENKRVGLDACGDGENLILSVWDEGCGIPGDLLDVIFRPFEQVRTHPEVKNRGTGLGLTITRKLVELHGGTVSVDSAAGKGSRFKVVLPGRTD